MLSVHDRVSCAARVKHTVRLPPLVSDWELHYPLRHPAYSQRTYPLHQYFSTALPMCGHTSRAVRYSCPPRELF